MKKTMKFILVLVVFMSCSNGEPKKDISKKIVNVEAVLKEYMSAWAKHDKNQIESFYDDNVIWYDLPSDYTTKGKQEVGKAITDAFLNNVSGMYWVKSGDVFVSDNTITYEWIYGGIFTGKWGDTSIENKKFVIKGISTTSVNNKGKIYSQKDYYDLYGFQKQLGILE